MIQPYRCKHSRDIFIEKDEGVLDVAFLCVDVSHADHLHAGAEVAARGHVVIHLHRASLLGESADSLLRLQTDVVVVRHPDSSTCNTGKNNRTCKTASGTSDLP